MDSQNQLKVKFANGQQIEFRQGRIDSWCVFIVNPDGSERIPLDTEIFLELKNFGSLFGNRRIYTEVFELFKFSSKNVDKAVLDRIAEIAKGYDTTNLESIKILYATLYYAFVAEENRAHTVLGKRVKMLGIHQVLLENYPPETAANCSKGMKGKEIAELCKNRGF